MNRVRQRPAGMKGFSLIEVIFAIAILGIGIVGILSLFTTGINRATWAQNTTTASMEVQSLVTRILTEVDTGTPPNRIVLDYIHKSGDAPGLLKHEWIHFDENMGFANSATPVRIDSKRDYFWRCRCKPVHSDRDAKGNLVDWYPPMNPEDPFDGNYKDASKSPNFVNGLYEIAISIYKSQDDKDFQNKKPISVYTTFVTAGF